MMVDTFKSEALENIILSEVSQAQKAKSCMFSHMWNTDIIKIQQCYEKLVTPHIREAYGKRRKLKR
jgi:hypothetical protein